MSSNGLKTVEVKKDLGIIITSDLKCSQQCEYAYSKANRVLGMISSTITYKKPKITCMLSLYNIRLWSGHMWSIVLVRGTRLI